MNQMVNTKKVKQSNFNWQDPFLIEQQLTSEERMIRDAAAAYCQDSYTGQSGYELSHHWRISKAHGK